MLRKNIIFFSTFNAIVTLAYQDHALLFWTTLLIIYDAKHLFTLRVILEVFFLHVRKMVISIIGKFCSLL